MNACTALRTAVLSSAGLLASGILVLLLAQWLSAVLPPAAPYVHAALWLVLAAVVTLAAALVVALWPGRSHLEGCIH